MAIQASVDAPALHPGLKSSAGEPSRRPEHRSGPFGSDGLGPRSLSSDPFLLGRVRNDGGIVAQPHNFVLEPRGLRALCEPTDPNPK